MKRFLTICKWFGVTVVALTALFALILAARVALYTQKDDRERVAMKDEYLQRIADLTGDAPSGPNVVVILFDDLGYGDLAAYGSKAIRTPSIDRLSAEGAVLLNAYAASPYCSASRAGLLTGRYAVRSGLDHVLQAPWTWQDILLRIGWRNRRLPLEEITLAEVLRAAGYATGIFGKWHLGDSSPSMPTERGFDTFYGLLHSNDQGEPNVWQDTDVVEEPPIDQTTLTRRYTERAVRFIEEHRDQPFFLYVPHTFPHIPLHVADDRRGRSAGGLYGDVVEELDWSVGEIVAALRRLELAEDTLVVVSSDNGPWFQGSSGGVRGRKFDVFEGGMRVPFVVSRPETIPAGARIDTPVVGVDLFPTVLEMAGLPLPRDRIIDGISLASTLSGGEPPGDRVVYFHVLNEARGLRQGRFKYHDAQHVFYGNPMDWRWGPMRRRGPWMFDLESDPAESYDLSGSHPDVARRMRGMLDDWRESLEANPGGWR
ncbi:MAG: sulfatase-like hydrolase/transferase [Acidobacteria bacterium]|nr:sulfatase-like hydrolase/transferase [Acidobacteriota bacterium]NIM60957.1 sulfatase-like hydrolase/transferase [Acidobacteriota bacterium]NIO60447.1 sulfatase-like hydrolase/transferase [Acidobacteriota bacterium]NIQ31545.1 sulfatase-like hydrolase/transferase [Acidobacteriota bacterium]NIQ86797.1 sulfatase-like hydrolase/transferase [Acidobacteriota bacterium]